MLHSVFCWKFGCQYRTRTHGIFIVRIVWVIIQTFLCRMLAIGLEVARSNA